MTSHRTTQADDAPLPVIYVVDDDDGVRSSLRWLVESVGYQVQVFRNGREFLDTYDPNQPGCMLLDVRMPVMGGFDLLEKLQERGEELPVLFLTGHGTIPMSVEALKQGAFDFIEKPFNDQDLIDRIQLAANQAIAAYKARRNSRLTSDTLALLSSRERDVVKLLIEGKPSKVIAYDLGISKKTVDVHRANIREKLKVSSVAELVKLVLKDGKAVVD